MPIKIVMNYFTENKKIKKSGFTLIEMLVAVFVFSIVMVVATGAIFSIVNANKSAQAMKSVLDNLNSALDNVSSAVRFGTKYHCDINVSNPALTSPNSCPNGATSFTFLSKDGVQIYYKLDSVNYKIQLCKGTSSNCYDLTAPEVHVEDMRFYVVGATDAESLTQPQVTMTIAGYAQNGANRSSYSVQTMITQRNPVCKDLMVTAGICIN